MNKHLPVYLEREKEKIPFPNTHVHFREYKGAFDVVTFNLLMRSSYSLFSDLMKDQLKKQRN